MVDSRTAQREVPYCQQDVKLEFRGPLEVVESDMGKVLLVSVVETPAEQFVCVEEQDDLVLGRTWVWRVLARVIFVRNEDTNRWGCSSMMHGFRNALASQALELKAAT